MGILGKSNDETLFRVFAAALFHSSNIPLFQYFLGGFFMFGMGVQEFIIIFAIVFLSSGRSAFLK
jgi:hypothetical protein